MQIISWSIKTDMKQVFKDYIPILSFPSVPCGLAAMYLLLRGFYPLEKLQAQLSTE